MYSILRVVVLTYLSVIIEPTLQYNIEVHVEVLIVCTGTYM